VFVLYFRHTVSSIDRCSVFGVGGFVVVWWLLVGVVVLLVVVGFWWSILGL